MNKCSAGYELPTHGRCKKCGADEDADICYEYPRQLERRVAELEQQLAESQAEVERLKTIRAGVADEIRKETLEWAVEIVRARNNRKQCNMELALAEQDILAEIGENIDKK